MMKLLKALSVLIFALTFTALGMVLSYQINSWTMNQQYTQGWSDGYAYIKPIEDLQRQVGAVPDGIIGPETIAKYELAHNTQQAEWSMCSNVREFDQAMMMRIEK